MNAPEGDNLKPALEVELSRHISAVHDQIHTDEQIERLNELLLSNPEARQFYLDYVALQSVLSSSAGCSAGQESEKIALKLASSLPSPKAFSMAGELDRLTLLTSATKEVSQDVSRRPGPIYGLLAIAAALCFVALPLWYLVSESSKLTDSPEATVAVADDTPREDAHQQSSNRQVATVSRVSSKDLWKEPNHSYSLQSMLRAGQKLSLADGEVELTYDTGVRLRLLGPAEFLVRESGGVLEHGGLVASVPESGHGFTIETPNGKVIDLGTQFGVVVDDFGFSEVSVFEGKVEAYPTTLAESGQEKFELTEGDALQWTKQTISEIKADPRRFASSALSPLAGSRFVSNVPLAEVRSTPGSFQETDWRIMGRAETGTEGIVLQGETGFSRQPYVISQRQFDPKDGPITIACDVVFPVSEVEMDSSIAILTRASDIRGGADSPWEDTLATCVRCGFASDIATGDGTLEAATKHESGWEPVKLSWRGFHSPVAGQRYRLTMRDDGVNVSFTVAFADNPGIKKTVRCRSLFQGEQSFVAIEGPKNGEVLIENVHVVQESRSDSLASLWPMRRAVTPEDAMRLNSAEAYEELLPRDAELVLEDDFADGIVDADKWRTLGEVFETDGRLQLGEFLDDVQIDTWHQRPYLLTRLPMVPGEGRLTVVGRLEFAENFLSGYGGSFAVMTRCSDSHSKGPAWQNSLVTYGIRSNFWPLGLGTEHSLEIHEKPSPKSISLLAAESFPIDPRSRSYLFKLVDDGASVTLTVVDAIDATKRKTISEKAPNSLPQPNYIGFESTWGSPVLLDDIRIYRSKAEVASSPKN